MTWGQKVVLNFKRDVWPFTLSARDVNMVSAPTGRPQVGIGLSKFIIDHVRLNTSEAGTLQHESISAHTGLVP